MADEAEPPEALEFVPPEFDGEDEPVGALPVLVVLPRRLVAAVNAEDALELFDEEPEDAELEELEPEDDDAVEPLLPLEEESRPRSPRLPLKFGVTSEA